MSYSKDVSTTDTGYETEHSPLPCRTCGTLTKRSALSMFGARCHQCYLMYCRMPQSYVDTGNKNDSPKAWAYALKKREENGEPLSSVQRTMWRAALKQVE